MSCRYFSKTNPNLMKDSVAHSDIKFRGGGFMESEAHVWIAEEPLSNMHVAYDSAILRLITQEKTCKTGLIVEKHT